MKMKLTFLAPFLFFLVGCNQNTGHKKILWIHLEGAPVKTLFDHWIEPLKESENSVTFHQKEWTLPETYNKKNQSLLENWVSVRGIQTSSPHLKESRVDWLGFLREHQDKLLLTTQTLNLKKIYQQFFPKADHDQFNIGHEGTGSLELKEIQKQWSAGLNSDKPIHLTILNNTGSRPLYFEDIQTLDQEHKQELISFYQSLLSNLQKFVETLKKQKRFENTYILITSDRQKITNEENLVTTWEGINFSLLSGSLTGPFQMGHIYKSHPKYEENFPGTWGLGTEGWTTLHFQYLIEDLLIQENYTDSKNPWFHVRGTTLSPKLRWGQTF